MKNNDKFNLKYFILVVTENREGISVPVMNTKVKPFIGTGFTTGSRVSMLVLGTGVRSWH